MRKCERTTLYRDDADLLLLAARSGVPRPSHLRIVWACVNPGMAMGSVETVKIVTPEGVAQWWEMICDRDADKWRCDPAKFKQFIATSVVVGGVPRPIELSFDQQSSSERARALASRAIEIYEDPASRVPSCGEEDPKESDFLAPNNNKVLLPSGSAPIHVSVDHESVTLDDVDVDIDFSQNPDATTLKGLCWWAVIIVT